MHYMGVVYTMLASKDWDIFILFTCMMVTVVGTGRANVTYDCCADDEEELTVLAGDVLQILEVEPDGQEGWVMVSLIMVGDGGKIADGKCECMAMCMFMWWVRVCLEEKSV